MPCGAGANKEACGHRAGVASQRQLGGSPRVLPPPQPHVRALPAGAAYAAPRARGPGRAVATGPAPARAARRGGGAAAGRRPRDASQRRGRRRTRPRVGASCCPRSCSRRSASPATSRGACAVRAAHACACMRMRTCSAGDDAAHAGLRRHPRCRCDAACMPPSHDAQPSQAGMPAPTRRAAQPCPPVPCCRSACIRRLAERAQSPPELACSHAPRAPLTRTMHL